MNSEQAFNAEFGNGDTAETISACTAPVIPDFKVTADSKETKGVEPSRKLARMNTAEAHSFMFDSQISPTPRSPIDANDGPLHMPGNPIACSADDDNHASISSSVPASDIQEKLDIG